MSVPSLRLGGVALDCESFVWPFTAGAVSPQIAFEVGATVDKALQGLSNPVTLEVDVEMVSGGKAVRSRYRVEGLLLTERVPLDPWTVKWTIADERWQFQHARFSADFNSTRMTNERVVPTLVSAGGASAGADLGNANPDFNSVARYRYWPHTLRSNEGLAFAVPGSTVDSSGRPWTALEALRYVLQAATKRYRGIKLRVDVQDNGYQLQDEEFKEEELPRILSRLLNLARAGLYVAADGTWVVYDGQGVPPLTGVGNYEGAGLVEVRDLSRACPAKVRVRFPKEYEIRFDFCEGVAGQTTGRFSFDMENVLPLPETVGKFPRGLFVRISDGTDASDAETALSIWNNDTANPWPNGQKVTLALLRKLMTSSMLFQVLSLNPAGGIDPVLANRCAMLRQHYRQTFRIPIVWQNMIERWTPYLVSVISKITGRRQPSPVWQDYTLLLAQRLPGNSALPQARNLSAVQRAWPEGSAQRPALKDGRVAPATIEEVSQELGVFRVAFYPDLQNYVGRYIPSALKRDIALQFTRDPGAVGPLLEGEAWADDFHLSTLISCSFSTPNGSERMHEVEAAGPGGKGSLHTYDVPYMSEPARYAWVDGQSSAELKDGLVQLQGFDLVNESVLSAVARGMFNRIAYSYANHVIGVFKKVGFNPADDRPLGRIKGVAMSFAGTEGLQAVYDVSEPPEAPDLRVLLPKDVRQYVYRQIESQGE